jgi:3-oxoacyl-[acyl-carrier-protein] synthase III
MAKLTKKSKLTLNNAPITKRPENQKKLGLKTHEHSKMRSYKLRVEAIEALDELVKEANRHTNIKLSATKILELLINRASKRTVKEVIESINTD